MSMSSEQLVQIGMRAVIRDVQEVIDNFSYQYEGASDRCVDVKPLKAYLMSMLIAAGGYDIPASDNI